MIKMAKIALKISNIVSILWVSISSKKF
jgi:hypothetical protein